MISSNNEVLFKDVLKPRLLDNACPSCRFLKSLINFNLFPRHRAHFDNIIVLPLLEFEITGVVFSVFFYTFDNKIALFYI